jgi:hypothetical protein
MRVELSTSERDDHLAKRRNAMELLERQRKALGLTWEEIVVGSKRRD